MATYKTSQFFKIKSSTDLRVPVPSLSELNIQGEFYGRKLTPVGEFPRRLSIGDIIFQDESARILSPANGIAHYYPSTSTIRFTIDGELNFKPQAFNGNYSLESLKQKIDSTGLVSLDFPGQSLSGLFSSLIPDRESFILFVPFTKENLIDYRSKIFEVYKNELEKLKKNIKEIFPNVNVIDFLTDKKMNYIYPEGSPRYFLHKYVGIDIAKDFPKDRFLYLGPETIYHLIRGLYFNIPFHERYVSVNIINQSGTLEGETKAFLLKNGLNLSDFLNSFQTRYKYFTVNSFYDKQPVYEIGTEFIFDIYKHHSVIICDRIHFEKNEKSCTDCNDCSYYCPVAANPRAILDKDKTGFNSSVCLDCGICSLLCPSHIDLSTRIAEIKQGASFVIP
ncbi:MAG TPA: hypothetical protein PK079_04205 [Leptospiraceae bacterium]|nr:hypothetical protein [Leptospiraceae bacterium]HMW05440.1 hypothetical protein [Leptospiraceae bacterium]HMX31411.1 hypothetical protein [Leptospiraceae bacterium]HMY30950.1 hypothetical protein [Leptospiraceae bacterium]HMZ63361.1 hypothetical protein [Leptospiraceae bacterium]